ncbi:MerR family transcriptional regulator [Cohnella yongneupensis]|uniref:MerR family transcriptional regulator n=1 Tax=Cohnella yongneupensis TaxID=425006 RepID=A0ABW0QUV5_9BACL
MNIKEAAEKTGISAHTLRFYEKSGLFPKIKRSKSGIREFTDTDISFLMFLTVLKKTGMSLDDIADFTKDGCILERIESGEMPKAPLKDRLRILKNHRNHIVEQQREIELLLHSVNKKISFYEHYMESKDEIAEESEQNVQE